MAFLTIITPTYNRAAMLPKCFDSLQSQTSKRFEWIIVDDGSTDDTQTVIAGFVPDGFSITGIRKENGGKHTALNEAHSFIHGDYVLILDSDDYLVETAVEEILDAWNEYEPMREVGLVTFLRGRDKEHPLCTVEDYNTPVDIMRHRRNVIAGSDCCEVIRSELFLKYPFPQYTGERFIAECALWNRVSFTHKVVYIRSVIYICEYLEGGLTKSGRSMRIRNPKGGMFTSDLRMDRRNYFSQRVKYGVLYTCYARFAKVSFREMLQKSRSPLLACACTPAGILLYAFWNTKYRGRA